MRTLYGKLLVALLGLLALIGGLTALVVALTLRVHREDVAQRLHGDLARHLVAENPLLQRGILNIPAMQEVFRAVRIISPGIDAYVVAPDGAVLLHPSEPGRIERDRIDTDPIRAFLNGAPLPIKGQDPRHPDREVVFSAAPIVSGDAVRGYLYVVLEGLDYASAEERVIPGTRVRLSAWGVAGVLAFALVSGAIGFRVLTQRLRDLARATLVFEASDFSEPLSLARRPAPTERGDEIDALSRSFEAMSQRIADHIRGLREADETRRELVAAASHDLRTPLASLQGYVETLLLKDEELSADERRAYLRIAGSSAKRVSALVDDLFELARLDVSGAPAKLEPFSLDDLVSDVLQKFRLRAEGCGVTLLADVPPAAAFARGDLGMIERILENLLDNALRHTTGGGTVHVAAEPLADRVRVAVRDTGEGFPEAELPRIFEPFIRGPAIPGEEDVRTGLGLAIARRIVELHGGAVAASNPPEGGAVVAFDLPGSARQSHGTPI